MHKIQFRLGLRPRPRWGSLQRSPRRPDPLAGFQGPTSKSGERGGEWEGEGDGRDKRGETGEKGQGKGKMTFPW